MASALTKSEVSTVIKEMMASRFLPIETDGARKPWFCQIKTKYDRISTAEPTFIRQVVVSSLVASKVLAEHLRSSIGREPTFDDHMQFLTANESVRQLVYEQVCDIQIVIHI
jgi:hypothetical protein